MIKDNVFMLCIGCVLVLVMCVVVNRVYKDHISTTIEINKNEYECTGTIQEPRVQLVGKVSIVTHGEVCINYKRIAN